MHELGATPAAKPRAGARDALWHRRLALEEHWRLREGTEKDFRSFRSRLLALSAGAMLKVMGLYQRGRRNALAPVLREETFSYAALPIFLERWRILHVSDFHFSARDPAFVEAAHETLDSLEVDLCLLTGDYRYGYYGPQEGTHEPLRRALAGVRSRLGMFGVLGNHDLSDLVPGLEELGIRVLINEGVAVDGLWIAGVDDPHKFRCDSVESAMRHAPGEAFKILLAHSPECVAEAAQRGADLYLCGHTHGGQVRFPFIGALRTNARCDPKHTRPRWRHGAMQGNTTDGLGATDLPVRFNCPPEAVLITLRRG